VKLPKNMVKNCKALVILESMYGYAESAAPRWFCINPGNHSGKRLYSLTGLRFGEIYVTNCHHRMGTHSGFHGKPNYEWLADNLIMLGAKLQNLPLLICGSVARDTYMNMIGKGLHQSTNPLFYLKHPAARTWTKKEISDAQITLKGILLCSS
jgi:hypothetical protein